MFTMITLLLAAALVAAAVLRRRSPGSALVAAFALALPACSASGDGAESVGILVLAAMALSMLGVVISTGVPNSILRPGTFQTFVFSTAQRGLTPLPNRVLMIGTMLSTGTATAGAPTQIFDAADADAKFGQGAPVTLMARKALEQAAFQGTSPEIWVVGIAEPGGGTKNVHTLTVSGPAAADGNVTIRIAGRTIVCGVASGQSADTVASALQQKIAEQHANLPIVASVVGAVVSCTATVKGENGGDVDYSNVELPTGIGVAHATGAAGAGAIDITAALDAAIDRQYQGIAIENTKAGDVTDSTDHTTVQWSYSNKRYRWIFMGETTSISNATARAAAANDYRFLPVSWEDSPSLPCELAAAVATRVWGTERANANYDGMVVCLYPPPAASSYTAAEIESLLQGGVTPLVADSTGTRGVIVRLVTSKVTTASAPDYSTFDLAASRVAALMAQQIDIRHAAEFNREDSLMDLDEDSPEYIVDGVRDMLIGVHRDFEALRYIQNVDEKLEQIQAVPSATIGRLDGVNPIDVISPYHQLALVHQVQIG